ncbi:extracellular solute-binding protein [Marinobacter sp.]|uniref:extracellular solute-binding protein n=1 Tax=Marinobacter sp. TaxID=50741 RepID=UPI0034A55AF2
MTKTRTASYLTSFCSLVLLVSAASVPVQAAGSEAEPRHAIAMHGDPKYSEGFSHFDYVNPDAPKGGTLRMAVVANGYDSFNPFVVRGVPASGVTGYVYDTLLESSDDEPFSAYGLIAESLETPKDRSYVTFNLRKEARFHDGKPITADDVKFSFDILTTEGHPFYRNYYADVSKVTVEGERRVRFDFSDTSNRELPLILGQMPIMPADYWEDREFGRSGLTPPVGSGPYEIGDFEAGRSVTFERVEDYWAQNLGPRKGRFNFDKVRYDYYSDDTVALEAFKAGSIDFRVESSAKNWATAYTGERFDKSLILTESVEHHRPAGMQAFVFNTRKSTFSDRRVREALGYAFDFEWANKNLFYDQYTRTKSFFENSELASSGLPEGRELEILTAFEDELPEDVFTKVYQPPRTDGEGGLRDNFRKAMALLKDAGYAIRDGNMVHTDSGERLSFEVLLHQKNFERVVLPLKNNLDRLGIDVSIRLVDTNQYVQRVRQFDYDVVTQVLPQSDSPGNEQREFWHSSNINANGSRNYMGVNDPVVDALIDKVIQAPDREELVYRVRALDRVLLHGHYVIPQWYLPSDRIAYWAYLKRPASTPKNGVDVDNWWLQL